MKKVTLSLVSFINILANCATDMPLQAYLKAETNRSERPPGFEFIKNYHDRDLDKEKGIQVAFLPLNIKNGDEILVILKDKGKQTGAEFHVDYVFKVEPFDDLSSNLVCEQFEKGFIPKPNV